MKFINFNKPLLLILFSFLISGCGSSSENKVSTSPVPKTDGGPGGGSYIKPTGVNVMKVTVNGSLCDPNTQYLNEPCASVTICEPGTNNCQTINNILVDTGSFGLRIFSSLITVPLTPTTDSNGHSIGECATFGSGADWGSVKSADVILGDLSLGGEKAPNVPIHVIDSTFSNFAANPAWCNNGSVDRSPMTARFNGILGVGVFPQDCGPVCDPNYGNNANNGIYFSCFNNACQGSTLSLAKQVINPIALLPMDNNGAILSFPGIGAGGAPSIDGSLVLGIGTRSNNTPANVAVIKPERGTGEFLTTYNGKTSKAIFDSGTNAYSFDDSNITTCSSNSSFYCPTNETKFTATQHSFDNSYATNASFWLGDIGSFPANNWAYSDVGDKVNQNGGLFIWGLPYFFAKTLYFGLYNKTSQLGTGPYFAY